MSSTFAGFTETDIRNLQGQPKREIKKCAEKNTEKLLENKPKIEVPPQALLSSPLEVQQVEEIIKNDLPLVESSTEMTASKSEIKEADATSELEVKVDIKVPLDFSNFEAKQKLIEEQNRVRKKQLMRRLADKSQKTKEEFKKLQVIQDEVNKLDNKLSNDVNVLRTNIDDLSLTYMTAEKRFRRLEKEYLDAKLSMRKLREKKELLTEHLCTVIVNNEERKADKLTELLGLLDLPNEEQSIITRS